MKKSINIILLIIVSLFLVSCNEKEETYKDFENKHLTATNAFKQGSDDYYLYIYKVNCPYCEQVKDLIFKQAKDKETPLYFINELDVTDVLKRTDEPNYNNYDARSLSEVKINGVPTLLLISKSRVIDQFVGASQITQELG